MDFFETVSARQSVRAYRPTEITDAELEKILTAANAAPSAGDLQSYEIVVVRHTTARSALVEAAHGQAFLAEAPVVLVFLAAPDRSAARYATRGKELFCLQDATIAACYAQLAATALGLGSCWVGAFNERRVARVLNAPARLHPVCLLAIGQAAQRPVHSSRRQLTDFIPEERFTSA